MRRSARERKPVCQVYVPDSPPAVVRRKRKAKLAPAGRVAKRKKQRSGRARPPKKFPAGPFPLGALQDGLKAAAGEFKLSKTILQAVMRARPKPKAFRLLRRNFCRDGHVRQKFLTPLPEGDWPTCGCSAGVGACGPLSNCANRSLFMECLDGKCTAGGACGNGALQRRQFPPTEVYHSGKCGFGLRALSDIGARVVVEEYLGEVIDNRELRKRLSSLGDGGDYYFAELSGNLFLDAGPMGSKARFANHSCAPNCTLEKWSVGGEPRVALVTIRAIKRLEPLCYNYRADDLDGEVLLQRCQCGSDNCCGVIGGQVERSRLEEWEESASQLVRRKRPTGDQVDGLVLEAASLGVPQSQADLCELLAMQAQGRRWLKRLHDIEQEPLAGGMAAYALRHRELMDLVRSAPERPRLSQHATLRSRLNDATAAVKQLRVMRYAVPLQKRRRKGQGPAGDAVGKQAHEGRSAGAAQSNRPAEVTCGSPAVQRTPDDYSERGEAGGHAAPEGEPGRVGPNGRPASPQLPLLRALGPDARATDATSPAPGLGKLLELDALVAAAVCPALPVPLPGFEAVKTALLGAVGVWAGKVQRSLRLKAPVASASDTVQRLRFLEESMEEILYLNELRKEVHEKAPHLDKRWGDVRHLSFLLKVTEDAGLLGIIGTAIPPNAAPLGTAAGTAHGSDPCAGEGGDLSFGHVVAGLVLDPRRGVLRAVDRDGRRYAIDDVVRAPRKEAPRSRRNLPELHCFCGLPETEGASRTLVCCAKCSKWYHPKCVSSSVRAESSRSDFFCPICLLADGVPSTISALPQHMKLRATPTERDAERLVSQGRASLSDLRALLAAADALPVSGLRLVDLVRAVCGAAEGLADAARDVISAGSGFGPDGDAALAAAGIAGRILAELCVLRVSLPSEELALRRMLWTLSARRAVSLAGRCETGARRYATLPEAVRAMRGRRNVEVGLLRALLEAAMALRLGETPLCVALERLLARESEWRKQAGAEWKTLLGSAPALLDEALRLPFDISDGWLLHRLAAAEARASRAAQGDPEGATEGSDAATDSEEDASRCEFCICRGPDDGTFMVGCSGCGEWFHQRCMRFKQREGRAFAKGADFDCIACCEEKGRPFAYVSAFAAAAGHGAPLRKKKDPRRDEGAASKSRAGQEDAASRETPAAETH